ncbi:unnamed protein product [Oncorhynchus mykiss]|uniref:Band 3 cytoplasmic domain-containing protein n=1 Tax=Oncorhynchus mykiss TaxID=8022 RepID=A0A060XT98_ONCMY|nr:unnamed protein product [Oncorhynchus mykiss]
MWLGEPSWSSDRLSRACWVYGHQSLDTLCLGKSVFSFSHPPFSLSHLLPFFLPLHTLNSLLCLLYPSTADTPAQRVQFLLGTEDGDEEHIPHALFTELDEICLREGEDAEWKETARWLKFEEDVEDGGERWSKPYVATLSLHSLFELRSCILNGTVLLDMRANSLEEIAGT